MKRIRKNYREVPILTKIGCFMVAFAITIGLLFVFFIPIGVWILTGNFTNSDDYVMNVMPLGFILVRASFVGIGLIVLGIVFDF